MAKWISDGSVICKEVQGTRAETHNSVTGVPSFRVRLEVPRAQYKTALAKILGIPEQWPYTDTVFSNVRAISGELVPDAGAYTTDGDSQLTIPTNPCLVDFTYAPRTGKYIIDDSGEDAYWEDILEPRNETIPLNHLNFIWGNTTDTVPNDKKRTLSADGCPAKFEPGDTLTHIIEGWVRDTSGLELFVGTCSQDNYTSPVLNRTFQGGTLLLKNVQITKTISFRSYREPFGSPVFPLIEFSGKATPYLKFVYEYRPKGWQKFYRTDPNKALYPPGYYYIRHHDPPYDKFEPFPNADHSPWMGYL